MGHHKLAPCTTLKDSRFEFIAPGVVLLRLLLRLRVLLLAVHDARYR